MKPQDKLFRKKAIERMASPERLDEMLAVTAPAGWWALSALGMILVATVVWSIYGRVPIQVLGEGLLIRGAAVLDVSAQRPGRVSEILVAPGDVLQPGAVVARVSQAELSLRLDNTREQFKLEEAQRLEQDRRSREILRQLRIQRTELREKVKLQEDLYERGLVTRTMVLSTNAQLASNEQAIAQEEAQRERRTSNVAELANAVEELEGLLDVSTEVTSPYEGRVLELTVDSGNLISAGQRLLTLEELGGSVEAVIYIPASEGKKVRPGMEVRVSPSTVKAEEYGYIIGEVIKTSNYPVSPAGMQRVLRNEKLVAALSEKGAHIEVVARLAIDPDTESGYRWSSSQGPPHGVFSGTICEASVVVESKRPISYVLPILREAVGAI